MSPTKMVHEVELATIRDNPRPVRGIDNRAVASLGESIGLVGQLEPITLGIDRTVIFGRQRIAAQRARGETTIMAIIVDLPHIQARIATLDENLVRLELTAFQRAELLAERKALHEQLHPGSRHGAALTGEDSAPGFTRSMAELTGRGRSTIAEDCRIGALPDTVRSLIRGTPLEHRKSTLLELAKLPGEAEQLRACRALLDGSATDIAAALRVASDLSYDEPGTPEEEVARCDDLEPGQTATRRAADLVENALEPLEDWLDGADTSPEIENRFIGAALALSNYSASLLERAASGIEAAHSSSAYAKRARRTARALTQRAERMRDELVLIAECSCDDGCSACGFARGLAAVDGSRRGGGEPVS